MKKSRPSCWRGPARSRSRAGVLIALALIPGLPKFSFLFVAALLGGAALRPRQRGEADRRGGRRRPAGAQDAPEQPALVDPLSIEIGYALVALADDKQGGTLLNRLRAIRSRSPPRPASSCRRST